MFCRACRACGEKAQPHAPDELPDAAEFASKERCARHAHRGNPALLHEVKHRIEYARQDVKVLMAVRMRQGKPRHLDLFELRTELRAHFFHAHLAHEKSFDKYAIIRIEYAFVRHE